MDKLHYKDYYGSIEFNEQDNCLYGKVLGMPKDLISYEGNTASELYDDFKGAVEDYLALCKSSGKKPHKSYSGTLNIRIPSDIHSQIATVAASKGTSINSFIIHSIERQLQEAN
ncbi:MAG: type II toxin-antitoxin system HicB family antitoxin [Dysgonamonadaceae bacterium]|jgi:predicted HicB family RNase H-like nuclease|nr:type II toxin-antitoxin system HicB family antitoxin [Dysgonamonadaceae bacterium]